MRTIVVFAALLAVALATPELYTKFLREHNKHYEGEELFRRYDIFVSNLKKIEQYNKEDAGRTTYGITPLADLSQEEFVAKYTNAQKGFKMLSKAQLPIGKLARPQFAGMAPESYDWRDHKAVTEVKDQGQCGSCWAFSTVANLEGLFAQKNGSLLDLAPQNLVDCDKGCMTIDGEEGCDEGCNGGLPIIAYNYVKNGIMAQKDYPYTAKDGKCAFKADKAAFKVNGGVQFPQDETKLMDYLVQTGPLSIGIDATTRLQLYKSGVFEASCGDQLNHAVTLVGYGVDSATSKPFWTIKNSWGASWGEKGYVRFIRGKNQCGMTGMVTSATL